MRLPIGWLGVFTPLEDLGILGPVRLGSPEVHRLVDELDSLGLVVEGIEEHRAADAGVVTARVLAIHRIEGADRIRLVEVDDGSGRPRPVVCGAWNFAEGDVVPLALPGTRLPTGVEIEPRTMRGVRSEGMLCSAPEAGIGSDASGLALLPATAPLGTPVAEAFGITDEVVLDLAVEPNRPDASGVRGIARDLAARRGAPFTDLAGSLAAAEPTEVPVEGGAVERFLLAALDVAGARLEPRMARWLGLAGYRSISPIVDATNAVMHETGQPSHAYDRDRLSGGIVGVRSARRGEVVRTLDGRERILAGGELVIVDASDRAVGLAGIMGGEETEVGPTTARVLLEVAAFPRERIARASRATGLRTEASWRFERGTDPAAAEAVAARVAAVANVAARLVADVVAPRVARTIRVSREAVRALVGAEVAEVAFVTGGHLERLGFSLVGDAAGWEVTVPTWRPDVEGVADVVEEALRQVGYDVVPPRRLLGPHREGPSPRQRLERAVSQLLADLGAFEAWSVTMVGPEVEEALASGRRAPKIANPLRPEEGLLRTTILAGLFGALERSVRRNVWPVRLFEWGPVFWESGGVVHERTRLGLLVSAEADGGRDAGVWLARILARVGIELDPGSLRIGGTEPGWPRLHPGRMASLLDGAEVVGVFGELHPATLPAQLSGWVRLGYCELDGEWLLAVREPAVPRAPGSHPASELDLSFDVPVELAGAALVASLRAAFGAVARDLWIFDEFHRDGHRYLGVRARIEREEGVVDDELVASLIEQARSTGAGLGAVLRTAPGA